MNKGCTPLGNTKLLLSCWAFSLRFATGRDPVMLQLMQFLEELSELHVVSSCSPVWLQEVSDGYLQDVFSAQLLTDLTLNAESRPNFSLCNGVLRFKGRVWIDNNPSVQDKIISALHSSPLGGTLVFLLLIVKSSLFLLGPR